MRVVKTTFINIKILYRSIKVKLSFSKTHPMREVKVSRPHVVWISFSSPYLTYEHADNTFKLLFSLWSL